MNVALVHDWLTGMRGGEKCLEVLCELFPGADLYTLLHVPGSVSPTIEDRRIFTSFVQRLPLSSRWYRHYLPLMPSAVESFDLGRYDLVISTSHCVAKGAIPAPGALHLSYVHTPMRYAWDLRSLYFPKRGFRNRYLVPALLHYLRSWDVASTARVDEIAASSRFVAGRVARYWRREATVIHPPVDTEFFSPTGARQEGFYLVVSALVPYKGVDLAVRAFNRLGRPLKVVGRGPMLKRLAAEAGPTIEFTGWLSDESLRSAYEACRAVVFPSLEDFGIVPLEAGSMGRPVIALGLGGALETVIPANERSAPDTPRVPDGEERVTGVFFPERTPEALVAAVRFFERHEQVFSPGALRAHARRYERSRFSARLRSWVGDALDRRGAGVAGPAGCGRSLAGRRS